MLSIDHQLIEINDLIFMEIKNNKMKRFCEVQKRYEMLTSIFDAPITLSQRFILKFMLLGFLRCKPPTIQQHTKFNEHKYEHNLIDI